MTARFLLDAAHSFPGLPADQAAPSGLGLGDWLEFLRGHTEAIFREGSSTSPAELPGLVIPEHYEARYAYPLIVWIADGQQVTPAQAVGMLSGISTRNYLGLVFRPTPASETADGHEEVRLTNDIRRLEALIKDVGRKYHVHGERIYIGGFGVGGTAALSLMLAQPQWFAGVFSLSGNLPVQPRLLRQFRGLRTKRVLLGRGLRDQDFSASQLRSATRLLHTAGMRVSERTYANGREVSEPMLRDIDRWVMHEIYHPQLTG